MYIIEEVAPSFKDFLMSGLGTSFLLSAVCKSTCESQA